MSRFFRPYFQRQAVQEDRVIWQWVQGGRTLYEGAHFVSAEAASRFELSQLCNGACGDWVCKGQGWDSFGSWEDAERWLVDRQADQLISHTHAVSHGGNVVERPR